MTPVELEQARRVYKAARLAGLVLSAFVAVLVLSGLDIHRPVRMVAGLVVVAWWMGCWWCEGVLDGLRRRHNGTSSRS